MQPIYFDVKKIFNIVRFNVPVRLKEKKSSYYYVNFKMWIN